MHPQGMQFFDESQQQSFTRGRAAEKATDVLDILDARGLAVSDSQRDRIISCSDLDLLTLWLRRAITANSTDELFG